MSKSITYEDAMMMINELVEKTKRPVCKVNLTKEKCSIFDSKMGGIPYCPQNEVLPVDEAGKQLWLLAQINFKQMPNLPDFPTEGILQFFIALNDVLGLDFKNWTSAKNFRVIYYKYIDDTINEEDIRKKIKDYGEKVYPPIPLGDEYKINFVKTEESMSICDNKYNKEFLQIARKYFPDKNIKSFFDLNDKIIDKAYNDKNLIGTGTKIGGYPFFTQDDPRYYGENKDYDILLFQSDSDLDLDIMWGDCGVANFFIKLSDLKKLDFSKVGYNWDCY